MMKQRKNNIYLSLIQCFSKGGSICLCLMSLALRVLPNIVLIIEESRDFPNVQNHWTNLYLFRKFISFKSASSSYN